MRYVGNFRDILKREASKKTIRPLVVKKVEEEEEKEEEGVQQTFPGISKVSVHRQTDGQLTCGMRCLQNMYGPHIVSRKEMDVKSRELEKISHGIRLYNPETGFYASEVLESILKSKGKYVQRIALKKISSEYYVPIVELNPTFSGYIVALGGAGILKHYICIRYYGQYKKIDSMPGIQPCIIPQDKLFKKQLNGDILCGAGENRPVIAVLAVGSTPFVEYNILHRCWKEEMPPVSEFQSIVLDALDYKKQRGTHSQKLWFKKWHARRQDIDEQAMKIVETYVSEQTESEKNVVVHFHDQQTVINCKTTRQLVSELRIMGWISTDAPFVFKQGDCQVYHSDMPMQKLIDWTRPLHLSSDDHPHIGGFYTFNCAVSGTCTDKRQHSYSVRDSSGNVHVLHKKNINNITQ